MNTKAIPMTIDTILAFLLNVLPSVFGGITAIYKLVYNQVGQKINLTAFMIIGILIQAFGTGYLLGGGVAEYFSLEGNKADAIQYLFATFSTEVLAIIGVALKDKDVLSRYLSKYFHQKVSNDKK